MHATIIVFAAALSGPVPDIAIHESGCGFVAEVDGKMQQFGPFDDLHVLGGPERPPIYVTPGGKLAAVVCDRSTVAPVVQDFRVPAQFGVPLYINSPSATVRVELSSDGPSVTAVDGRWTDGEESEIKRVLSAVLAADRKRQPVD